MTELSQGLGIAREMRSMQMEQQERAERKDWQEIQGLTSFLRDRSEWIGKKPADMSPHYERLNAARGRRGLPAVSMVDPRDAANAQFQVDFPKSLMKGDATLAMTLPAWIAAVGDEGYVHEQIMGAWAQKAGAAKGGAPKTAKGDAGKEQEANAGQFPGFDKMIESLYGQYLPPEVLMKPEEAMTRLNAERDDFINDPVLNPDRVKTMVNLMVAAKDIPDTPEARAVAADSVVRHYEIAKAQKEGYDYASTLSDTLDAAPEGATHDDIMTEWGKFYATKTGHFPSQDRFDKAGTYVSKWLEEPRKVAEEGRKQTKEERDQAEHEWWLKTRERREQRAEEALAARKKSDKTAADDAYTTESARIVNDIQQDEARLFGGTVKNLYDEYVQVPKTEDEGERRSIKGRLRTNYRKAEARGIYTKADFPPWAGGPALPAPPKTPRAVVSDDEADALLGIRR